MRNICISIGIIVACFSLSYGKSYDIKSEQPASPKLDNYKNVYIGWLDLHESNWKNLGFKSQQEWSKAIKELNINALQAYCRDKLSGRTVTGSKGKGADAPGAGALYVKMTLLKHDVKTGLNRIQYLHMNIAFIDKATGAAKYTSSVVIDTSGFGLGNFTLEGQLNYGMKNLAGFIASRF